MLNRCCMLIAALVSPPQKCTGMILLGAFSGRSTLSYWQSYCILSAMFGTIFFQISWLNSGLRNFESLFIVPVFQSFWILVSVVAGMVRREETAFVRSRCGMDSDVLSSLHLVRSSSVSTRISSTIPPHPSCSLSVCSSPSPVSTS